MKKFFLFLAVLSATMSIAQNDEAFVDNQVMQKLAGLEMQENPIFFSRKDYCEGNVQMFTLPNGKLCTSKSTYYAVYVFWKEDGNNLKVQKFDNCGSFTPLTINGEKIMKLLNSKREQLQTEEIKPYKGEKIDENAFGNMEIKNCAKEYYFNLDGKSFEKSFKEYDLSNDSKYKNVNANYNNSLELISLNKTLSQFIDTFEAKGKFFREN